MLRHPPNHSPCPGILASIQFHPHHEAKSLTKFPIHNSAEAPKQWMIFRTPKVRPLFRRFKDRENQLSYREHFTMNSSTSSSKVKGIEDFFFNYIISKQKGAKPNTEAVPNHSRVSPPLRSSVKPQYHTTLYCQTANQIILFNHPFNNSSRTLQGDCLIVRRIEKACQSPSLGSSSA